MRHQLTTLFSAFLLCAIPACSSSGHDESGDTSSAVESPEGSDAAVVAKQYLDAFSYHDGPAMGALYKDGLGDIFQDPIFGSLDTAHTRAMWLLLLKTRDTTSDFHITHSEIGSAVGGIVSVKWTAEYTFTLADPAHPTKVKNEGFSLLKIEGGKIVQQTDWFDRCNWFHMAFGEQAAPTLCTNAAPFRAKLLAGLEQVLAPR